MTSHQFLPNCTQKTHNVPASYPRKTTTLRNPKARLQLSVDEYHVEDALKTGATLVLTHGTSFNKKLWEPTIRILLRSLIEKGCVKKILAIDASNHGESWLLNKGLLTEETHWPDQSRDILAVLKFFNVLGTVIGIGHSFGGGIMAHASIMKPEIFSATILIDPILFQMKDQTEEIANRARRRRDTWESLDDVKNSFRNSKGFLDWDPDVLSLHSNYSTINTMIDGKFKRVLKTPKAQEASTYLAAPYPQLPQLLKSSPQTYFFILGGTSVVIPEADRLWIQSISQSPGLVFLMEKAGHLIPMTHPKQLGIKLSQIITQVLERGQALRSLL